MNTIEDEGNSSTDDKLDAQRDIIRQSLNKIANAIGIAWRDVRFEFSSLYHRSQLWRRARYNCNSVRSIRCRLAAGIINSLSDLGRECWLRSVAWTGTSLRYCERRSYKCC